MGIVTSTLKSRLVKKIKGHEKLIKKIEYLRELYIYPMKMLGRKNPVALKNPTDVLVFAAHQDDDVLGLGTILYRHSLNKDKIKVVFITNGTGGSSESWNRKKRTSKKIAEVRLNEAIKALSYINIPEEDIFCLGFPDGGTQRYLNMISQDILSIIQRTNPSRIYVHCIEGGHRDHDLTSFVVKTVCNAIGFSKVYEWTEYNQNQSLGSTNVKFLPSKLYKNEEIKINITEEESNLKRKMLACHKSQNVEKYFPQGEALRLANTTEAKIELIEHSQFFKGKIKPIVEEFAKNILVKM